MSDKEKRLNRADKDNREQIEQTEEKSSFRILTQVVALIICLLLSFTVWLVVHYRADQKNDPPASSGEAAYAYSIDNAGL
ncbi:MAG: hypothetical protein IK090_02365 [Clostridia bacterium]|nr:hypothetical protein [Clostridia bacterium]